MVDFNFASTDNATQRNDDNDNIDNAPSTPTPTSTHTHFHTHTPAPLVANSFSIFSLEIEFQSYYKYFSGKCNFNGISPTLSLPTRAFIILARGDDILQS